MENVSVAPPVKNLEVYSVDENSADIRFQLPQPALGVPQSVYVRYCHPIFENNCKTEIRNLTKCALWDDFICFLVTELRSNYNFNISVSLKNKNTPRNGTPTSVLAVTEERGKQLQLFRNSFILFLFQFQVNR